MKSIKSLAEMFGVSVYKVEKIYEALYMAQLEGLERNYVIKKRKPDEHLGAKRYFTRDGIDLVEKVLEKGVDTPELQKEVFKILDIDEISIIEENGIMVKEEVSIPEANAAQDVISSVSGGVKYARVVTPAGYVLEVSSNSPYYG